MQNFARNAEVHFSKLRYFMYYVLAAAGMETVQFRCYLARIVKNKQICLLAIAPGILTNLFVHLLFKITKKCPISAAIKVIQNGNQETLVKFEGRLELLHQLPYTVDKLQKDWRSIRVLFLFPVSDTLQGRDMSPSQWTFAA